MSRIRPEPVHPDPPPVTVDPERTREGRRAGPATSDRSPLGNTLNDPTDAGHLDPGTSRIDVHRLLALVEGPLLEATMNNTGGRSSTYT